MEFNATFIVAFISFIVFTIIMNAILYKPLSSIVLKRKELIDSNYKEAMKNSDKSKSLLNERENKLDNATKKAKEKITDKTDEANKQKDSMTLNAKQEAQENLEKNRIYFGNATKDAVVELKSSVVNLAQDISDKFLKNKDKINNVDYELIESIMQGK